MRERETEKERERRREKERERERGAGKTRVGRIKYIKGYWFKGDGVIISHRQYH